MSATTLPASEDRLLRREEVLAMTGLSKAFMYDLISQDQFPRPVRIGQRAVAWWRSEVVAWMESSITTTDGMIG